MVGALRCVFFIAVALRTTIRHRKHLIITLDLNFATTNTTRPPGSDETDLATGGRTPLDGRSFTDVLMVTTTVGMLNGVHSHTTNNWPAVTLGLVFMVGTSSLQDGLVNTSTTSNNT